jgi:hypothetical protein
LFLGQPTHLVEVREHTEIAQQRLGLRLRRTTRARQALVELGAQIVGALLEIIEKAHATTVVLPPSGAYAPTTATPTGCR